MPTPFPLTIRLISPTYSITEYYTQRSCEPGTLIVSEATIIAKRHAGRLNVPGIWSQAQISAWREVNHAVHSKGCRIWCQLWAQGRAGHVAALESVGSKLMSSSAVPLRGDGMPMPVGMTEAEIRGTIDDYANAARNAIDAGFDGVEIHGYRYAKFSFTNDLLTPEQRQRLFARSIPSRYLQSPNRHLGRHHRESLPLPLGSHQSRHRRRRSGQDSHASQSLERLPRHAGG